MSHNEMINTWDAENALSEELTDAELAEVQGGNNYYVYVPVNVTNQVLLQFAFGNVGYVTQVGVQSAH